MTKLPCRWLAAAGRTTMVALYWRWPTRVPPPDEATSSSLPPWRYSCMMSLISDDRATTTAQSCQKPDGATMMTFAVGAMMHEWPVFRGLHPHGTLLVKYAYGKSCQRPILSVLRMMRRRSKLIPTSTVAELVKRIGDGCRDCGFATGLHLSFLSHCRRATIYMMSKSPPSCVNVGQSRRSAVFSGGRGRDERARRRTSI